MTGYWNLRPLLSFPNTVLKICWLFQTEKIRTYSRVGSKFGFSALSWKCSTEKIAIYGRM